MLMWRQFNSNSAFDKIISFTSTLRFDFFFVLFLSHFFCLLQCSQWTDRERKNLVTFEKRSISRQQQRRTVNLTALLHFHNISHFRCPSNSRQVSLHFISNWLIPIFCVCARHKQKHEKYCDGCRQHQLSTQTPPHIRVSKQRRRLVDSRWTQTLTVNTLMKTINKTKKFCVKKFRFRVRHMQYIQCIGDGQPSSHASLHKTK